MSKIKKTIIIVIAILVIIQFFQIDKTNPTTLANTDLLETSSSDDNIKKLVINACYDCHSNDTKYPWYTSFQPMGWMVRSHIRGGRNKLNFSEWGSYPIEKKSYMSTESANKINKNQMPLKSYTFAHPEAKLNKIEKKLLVDYFNNLSS